MFETQPAADPRPAAVCVGDPPSLGPGCLVAVGATGLLSFVRHSLLHRSDAARMGWDYGRRIKFQIEVGLANLAWGVVAILVVALGCGLAAEAAIFLVLGLYMGFVAVMQLFWPGGQRRALGPLIRIFSFAAMLLTVGLIGAVAV